MKHLILLIDALGYDSITKEKMPNLYHLFRNGYFKRVKTLLGYSNTIIPSIFSGKYPEQHGIWGVYKMSPNTSPFKISPLLPKSFIDKYPLLRYAINRRVFQDSKKRGLLPGHLTLINIPLKVITYFDLSMKKHIIEPNSLKGVETLFDLIRQKNISFKYVGYPWNKGNKNILELAEKHLINTSVVFAYIEEIDHNGHVYGINSKDFLDRLKSFDKLCFEFIQRILKRNKDISITIFSDHGMQDVNGTTDLKKGLDSLEIEIGKDYLFFLDSTIARFWAFNKNAREQLLGLLKNTKGGRLLSIEEIKRYGINFKSNDNGDLFYLADVGKLILPNFFSILGGSVKAMHGWDPDDKSQDSFIFTNRTSSAIDVKDVTKIFYLLRNTLSI